MTEPDSEKNSESVPRGAIAVVAVGLLCTFAVLAIDFFGGGTSADLEWATIEEVKTAPATKVGDSGEFSMDRTTLSAIAPNGGGELLFRIAGVMKVDTNGKKIPTEVRCDIEVVDPDSTIARTPKRRASWPRPSEELQAQEVPEASVVKFNAVGNDILGLPIRDAIRLYTNSESPTLVDWDGFEERTQNWVWTMDQGTGPSSATLGYVVIFKTSVRPEAELKCVADVDGEKVTRRASALQQEWPLASEDPEATDVE